MPCIRHSSYALIFQIRLCNQLVKLPLLFFDPTTLTFPFSPSIFSRRHLDLSCPFVRPATLLSTMPQIKDNDSKVIW